MDIRAAVAEYRSDHKRFSDATQRNVKVRLALFAQWCEGRELTLETLSARHIRAFLDDVGKRPGMKTEQVRRSTVVAYGQTVKAFITWLSKEEEFEDIVSPTIATRVALPTVENEVIEVFSSEQIEALLKACEKQPYPERDKALIAVLLDTGGRASELVGLTLDRVWLDADESYLKVMGKGRKEREIPLGKTARIALHRYITRYRKPVTSQEQHVFLNGQNGKPLTRSGLNQIVTKIGREATIKGVRCSPHTFRHTFACLYLLNGGDVYKLSRLMGHTSVQITERYLQAIKTKQIRQENHSVLDRLKSL